MGVPRVITPITGEEYLKSYNFVDTLTGQGVLTIFLCDTEDSVGKAYNLTTYTVDSADKYVTAGATVGAWGTLTDYDFDTTIYKPFQVEGKMLVNVTMAAISGGGGNAHTYLRIYLRRWDGTTETEIASNTTDTLDSSATTVYSRELVEIDVPKTSFKQGDTLRITIVQKGYGASGTVRYYIDPSNRTPVDTDNKSTTFVCFIPVVVQ